MKSATLVLASPDEQGQSDTPGEIRINGEVVARYEEIYYASLLDDETIVELGYLTGDTERVATIANQSSETFTFTVTGDREGLMYSHHSPDMYEKALASILKTHEISVKWPITFTERGIRFTILGEESALQQAIAAIPDEIRVTLERIGDHKLEVDSPAWQLTQRQREIVRVAIEEGYYDIPRSASQRDIAARLNLARGTVAEHLRKVESKILRYIFA